MDWSDKGEPVNLSNFLPIPDMDRVQFQKFNLILLFGCEGTHKAFVRQRLLERYGFYHICFADLLRAIICNDHDPYKESYLNYLRNGCPPPPRYLFERMVYLMEQSEARNFLMDDLPVCASYTSAIASLVEPFARLPLVLRFTSSVNNCLERLLGAGGKYSGVITRHKMKRLLEGYVENEDIVMEYYRHFGMLKTFNCDVQSDVVQTNVNWVLDTAIARGDFGDALQLSQLKYSSTLSTF